LVGALVVVLLLPCRLLSVEAEPDGVLDGLVVPPAALVPALPRAVAPAEVVSLSDVVLDCSCLSFFAALLFFWPLCLPLSARVVSLRGVVVDVVVSSLVVAPAAAPVSPRARSPAVARSEVLVPEPRLPETLSLEPALVLAPAFAPVEPWVVLLCAAASWLNDTASAPEISNGNNLRICSLQF
jgi:hypothetical protein